MKSLIVTLLIFIAGVVGYLAYSELQKQNAVDDMENRIIQSRVADGIRAVGGPKAAINEYYNDYGKFPVSWNEAGISVAMMNLPSHIKDLELRDNGEILVRYNPYSLSLPPEVSVATLSFVPEPTENAYLNWSCVPSVQFGRQKDILPAACWP